MNMNTLTSLLAVSPYIVRISVLQKLLDIGVKTRAVV